MRKAIVTILALLIGLGALAIKPMREYRLTPEEAGLTYERLHVVTKDNYRIETWFYPAQDKSKSPTSANRSDKPTIIICNGDAGNMSFFQIALAEAYTRIGLNVVTFDWRGFGQSDPFEMDTNYLCYTEMLLDYDAVIQTVAARSGTCEPNIYCMGWSTGGYLTMIAAHRNRHVKGAIVRGVPSCFEQSIPLIKQQKGKTDANLIVPSDFPVDEMPLALAPKFAKPLMLVVGEQDERTPPWMSQQIYDALPAGTPRQLMIVKGAKHGGEEAPEFVDLKGFIARTTAFINRQQASSAPPKSL